MNHLFVGSLNFENVKELTRRFAHISALLTVHMQPRIRVEFSTHDRKHRIKVAEDSSCTDLQRIQDALQGFEDKRDRRRVALG